MIYDYLLGNDIKTNKSSLSLNQIKENCDKEFETFNKILESVSILETVEFLGTTVTHIDNTNLFRSIGRKLKEMYEKFCAYLTEIKAKLIDKFNKTLRKSSEKIMYKARDLAKKNDNIKNNDSENTRQVFNTFSYIPVFTKEVDEMEETIDYDTFNKIFEDYEDKINNIKDLVYNIKYNVDIGKIDKNSRDKESIRNKTKLENFNDYTESEQKFIDEYSSIFHIKNNNFKNIKIKKFKVKNGKISFVSFNRMTDHLIDMADTTSEIYNVVASEQRKMHQVLTPFFKVIENSNSDNYSYNLDTILPIKVDLEVIKKILDFVYGIYKAIIKCTIGNIKGIIKVFKDHGYETETIDI